jgi:hypothetical protein
MLPTAFGEETGDVLGRAEELPGLAGLSEKAGAYPAGI